MTAKEALAKEWAAATKQGCDHSEVQQHAYMAGFEKALSIASVYVETLATDLQDSGLVATSRAISIYAKEIKQINSWEHDRYRKLKWTRYGSIWGEEPNDL